ncbi:Palmitoyl-protein_thioesterase [Hexamita inflata]|uniref:Palmitoyl-protein thioesterase n=1 Tax=Hexamita inflata TaxID=28002 RepID=A0AA86UK65_9EUKA|nr:Palmitoyl-protein thioesterase [Hexamita inflata]
MLQIVIVLSGCPANEDDIPIILVHGFNSDESTFDLMLPRIKQDFPNRKVIAAEIMFGRFSSIFNGFSRYVRGAATAIRIAADGAECIDLIGHSQGGLVSRAYVQLYSGFYDNYYPEVRKLISVAGAQGGYYCDKVCSKFDNGLVNTFMSFFKKPSVAYSDFAQMRITTAAFWRDPYNFKNLYQKQCNILAQINGECTDQTISTGRQRFIKLTKFYTFYSNVDETLLPATSGNFAMYEPETGNYLPIMNNPIFLNDNFGLKTLYDAGKWKTCRVDILHMDFVYQEDFYNNQLKLVLQGNDAFTCL